MIHNHIQVGARCRTKNNTDTTTHDTIADGRATDGSGLGTTTNDKVISSHAGCWQRIGLLAINKVQTLIACQRINFSAEVVVEGQDFAVGPAAKTDHAVIERVSH